MKEKFYTDFSVKRSISQDWQMEDVHFHDLFEIYYSFTNNIKYLIDGKLYAVNRGDLFIFNNKELHKIIVPADIKYERYVLIFNPALVQDLSTKRTNLLEFFLNRSKDFRNKVQLDDIQEQKLLDLFKKAEQYSKTNQYGYDIYTRTILAEILLLINSFYRNYSYRTLHTEDEDYNRIKPVITYIHDNYDKKLSVQKIAAEFNLSSYHLGYLFKKATGFSIYDYIINLRIIKAKDLLREQIAVSKVCELVGFGSYSNFIRTFSKRVGISPGQYS